MTQLTPRLMKAIRASKLPDKAILSAIADAERPKPVESALEAAAFLSGASESPAPTAAEAPASESVGAMGTKKRQYRRRDMRAE